MTESGATDPPSDCALCIRLAEFRNTNAASHPEWFNSPVPSFGDQSPRLLIVGLAPGLKGANRTGRPFTGDYAGDLLYATLGKAGLTSGTYQSRPDDGLRLHGVAITNAVRCVPPQNKPIGAEIKACSRFLVSTMEHMQSAVAVLALGRIAHDSVLSALGLRKSAYQFGHGAEHQLTSRLRLFDSYHCSRYNTNTGRLTAPMFEDVVFAAAQHARIGNMSRAASTR